VAHVAGLYRYPVKGFNPEACEEIVVLDDGRVLGDRVLGFRFADTGLADDEWGDKDGFIDLMNTPGLARLRLTYDHRVRRLQIRDGGALYAEGTLDDAGRRQLAAAVEEFVLTLPERENPLSRHPERRPLRLVGDGITPRFQDRPAGYVTLHGRGSLAALAAAIGDPGLSEWRFRSNVAIEGLAAWEEQGWLENLVEIGPVQFLVSAPVFRCLATHASPETGLRDAPILTTLTSAFRQDAPTFAVLLVLTGPGGAFRVGDPLRVHPLP
jgi:uncharacterized protein YcbX